MSTTAQSRHMDIAITNHYKLYTFKHWQLSIPMVLLSLCTL